MSSADTPAYRRAAIGLAYDALNAVIWLPAGSDALRQALVDEVSVQPGDRVLELGCDTGLVTRHLVAAGADVTAVDRAPAMLARARRRAPGARYVEADALVDPVGSFDAVVLSFILHELESVRRLRLLQHAYAHLAPGGRVAILEWSQPEPGPRRYLWRQFVKALEPPPALNVLEHGLDVELHDVGLEVGHSRYLAGGRARISIALADRRPRSRREHADNDLDDTRTRRRMGRRADAAGRRHQRRALRVPQLRRRNH